MPDLGRFYIAISRFYGALVLRLYGAGFVALGALFLYWGGRGLIAYSQGVRAAWTEPGVCLLGVVAGPWIAWFGWRMARDSATRVKPVFSQSTLLPLSVMALGAAVVAVILMGTGGVPYAMLAATAGAAGLVRWWSRRGGRGEAQDAENAFFEEIVDLEQKDSAEAQRLMDQYFTAQAQKQDAKRAGLWDQAPSNRIAAEQLRDLLQQDLNIMGQALRDWEKDGDLTPNAKANLTGYLRQTEADLARVNGFLRVLKG